MSDIIEKDKCCFKQSSIKLLIEQNISIFGAYIPLSNRLYFLIINKIPVILMINKCSIMSYFLHRALPRQQIMMISNSEQSIFWLYCTKCVWRLFFLNIWTQIQNMRELNEGLNLFGSVEVLAILKSWG